MNTKSKDLPYRLKLLCLKISTPLIAVVAVSCAFLVETEQLDFSYPVEIMLKSIVKDTAILTISTK